MKIGQIIGTELIVTMHRMAERKTSQKITHTIIGDGHSEKTIGLLEYIGCDSIVPLSDNEKADHEPQEFVDEQTKAIEEAIS
tara:strand:+ start:6108 stop:6353 length:246 start_codon:yes stop_codon:yes gene_type:complete